MSTSSGESAPRPDTGRRAPGAAPGILPGLLRRRSCSIPTATAPRPSTTPATPRGAPSTTCGSASPTSPQAKAFYETIAPHAGLRTGTDTPDRVQFVGADGSFSLVRGTPTEHLHLAFPTAENASSIGSTRPPSPPATRSNGDPGERPRYHPGYYAAFVLDPDGNNIEVVNHNRG